MKSVWFSISLGLLVFVVTFTFLTQSSKEAEVNSSIKTISDQPEIQNQYEERSSDILEREPIKETFQSSSINSSNEQKGINPVQLEIPSIQLNAPVTSVGFTDTGGMEVPTSLSEVGWFEPGTLPGNTGSSVIAGHVDGRGGPAVFYNLKELEAGDQIYVYGKGGSKLTFSVQRIVSYPVEEAPIHEIFGPSNEQSLNLITCSGIYRDNSSGYSERLVVYTKLINEE